MQFKMTKNYYGKWIGINDKKGNLDAKVMAVHIINQIVKLDDYKFILMKNWIQQII